MVEARGGISDKARRRAQRGAAAPSRAHADTRRFGDARAQDSKCTGIRPRSVEILAHCGALAALGGAAALQPVADLPVYACSARSGPEQLLYSLRGSAAREGIFGAPPHRPCVAYSAEQWRVEAALEGALTGAVARPEGGGEQAPAGEKVVAAAAAEQAADGMLRALLHSEQGRRLRAAGDLGKAVGDCSPEQIQALKDWLAENPEPLLPPVLCFFEPILQGLAGCAPK